MASREPMWYCHECHAEMRPLMTPDPVCASCRGSFVEKIENTQDDPRQFAQDDPAFDPSGFPPGASDIFLTLRALMDSGSGYRPAQPRRPAGDGFALQFSGPQGTRTIRFGSPPVDPIDRRGVPTMSSFLGSGPGAYPATPEGRRNGIQGELLAHYLMAMLGPHDPRIFGIPEHGQMGDYVFNQEALDQIMTQLMENANSHRPVPAPEDVVAKLPREVLIEGSATLEKDCAVCKETFSLTSEDPDELVIVTLPCHHPFHEPCILPWLKSSATCPVCRFALVPQPGQSGSPGSGPAASGSSSRSQPHTPPPTGPSTHGDNHGRGSGGGGFIQNILSHFGSGSRTRDSERHDSPRHSPRGSPGSGSPTYGHRRSNSDPFSETGMTGRRSPRPYGTSSPNRMPNNGNGNSRSNRNSSSRSNNANSNLPGSWGEELD